MSNTRETLKSFFQKLGANSSTSINYNLDNEQGEEISRSNSDDLGSFKDADGVDRDLLETFLGDYLKFITSKNNNIYFQPGGNSKKPAYKRGDAIKTEHSINTLDTNYFVNSSQELANLDSISKSNYFAELSDPSFPSLGNETPFPIDKTGGDKDRSGNDAYKKIQGTGISNSGLPDASNVNDEDNDIIKLTQDYLNKNNRFSNVSPKEPFANSRDTSEHEEKLDTLINDEFGVHNKEKYKVKLDNLKKLGAGLLYNVSGFTFGNDEIDEIESSIDSGALSSKISGRDFIKRRSTSYQASKNKGYPENESGNRIRGSAGKILNPDSETFGSTYNPKMQFFGSNKKLHKIHALIAAKAIYTIYENLYAQVFEDLTQHSESEFAKIGKLIQQTLQNVTGFGSIYGKSKNLFNLRLDEKRDKFLVRTIYPYKNCIDRGLEVCLGPGILEINNVIRKRDTSDIDRKNPSISNSPGFWLSVCSTVIRSVSEASTVIESLSEETNDDVRLRELMSTVSKSPILKFFNAMATVGDISLRSTVGNSLDTDPEEIIAQRPFDVDSLPDNPGNRVGKSRMKEGKRVNQLSYSQGVVPSAYLMPVNIIRASVKMDKGPDSPNPLRAHLGSELVENTYIDVTNDGPGSRIPNEVIKTLEDKLSAEYVPFYIQDLRTNEIISFHAFLNQLSDTITPNFNSQAGYGRMDQVHIYSNTSRSVTVGFTLMATSKEDFDNMWFKINKITTLLYPQWTQGTMVGDNNSGVFSQPFSQVIGASPIVRLRVGDVIKSNYSKFNLGRVFGIGDQGIHPKAGLISNALGSANIVSDIASELAIKSIATAFGSPAAITNFSATHTIANKSGIARKIIGAASDQLTLLLKNGFVNPLTYNPVNNQLTDPENNFDALLNFPGIGYGYAPQIPLADADKSTSTAMLKANMHAGYIMNDTGEKIYFNRPITVRVLSRERIETFSQNKKYKLRTGYICEIIDPGLLSDEIYFQKIKCFHEDLLPLPVSVYTNTLFLPILSSIGTGTASITNLAGDFIKKLSANSLPGGIQISSAFTDLATDLFDTNENKFMLSENNPFVRAFETTQGRGLAGKLSGITFDWLDQTFNWETDYNSRAPMGCKISFTLDVIHDIPPGLDNSGYNRAPLYNVGKIMKNISGDVYNDNGQGAEANYNKSRIIKKG